MTGWRASGVVLVCALVVAWHLAPAVTPRAPTQLEVQGVAVVRHPAFERIDRLLQSRTPGWSVELREQLAEVIAEEASLAGLDPLLVVALIEVESEFESGATSIVGARGLMQIRPATLEWLARRERLKLTLAELEADPSLNVRLGVRYLKYLCEMFRGRVDLALMAYNAGPNKLVQTLKAGQPATWQNYVRAVQREYAALKLSVGEFDDGTLASLGGFGQSSGR